MALFGQDKAKEQEDLPDKAVHAIRERPDIGGAARTNAATLRGNGINYHGGPVILGTTNVYYIWYGNWSGNSATTILTDLANSIGGLPYFNINTTYYNGSNFHVSNSVHYVKSTTDNYSKGTTLSDAISC